MWEIHSRRGEDTGGKRRLTASDIETSRDWYWEWRRVAPSDVDVYTVLHVQWRHVAENDVALYKMLLIQWRHVGREWREIIQNAPYPVAVCRQSMMTYTQCYLMQWRHVGRKWREIIQNALIQWRHVGRKWRGIIQNASYPVAACRQSMMTCTQCYLCSGGM